MTSPTSGSSGGREPATAADLFGLLWRTLSDLLGSATTATLLRRSRNALARRSPAVTALQIDREGLEYRYTLPASWSNRTGDGLDMIRDLVGELRPLLMELTGAVILNQLDTNPTFAESGIVFSR